MGRMARMARGREVSEGDSGSEGDGIRGQLDQPGRWAPSDAEPLIVLVLKELYGAGVDGAALDQIGRYGPAFGVQVLAATARPAALDSDVLSAFATRLVLAVSDEEASIRLLGDPCAADLPAGRVALRLDGRRPLVMQG